MTDIRTMTAGELADTVRARAGGFADDLAELERRACLWERLDAHVRAQSVLLYATHGDTIRCDMQGDYIEAPTARAAVEAALGDRACG